MNKAVLNILADQCWCDGDSPESARLHLSGQATALNIIGHLHRAQAVILMVSIQDWLRSSQDRSREHVVAEITQAAAPGVDPDAR